MDNSDWVRFVRQYRPSKDDQWTYFQRDQVRTNSGDWYEIGWFGNDHGLVGQKNFRLMPEKSKAIAESNGDYSE